MKKTSPPRGQECGAGEVGKSTRTFDHLLAEDDGSETVEELAKKSLWLAGFEIELRRVDIDLATAISLMEIVRAQEDEQRGRAAMETKPSAIDFGTAADWLRCEGGACERVGMWVEAQACKRVGNWLDAQAESLEFAVACQALGMSPKEGRAAIKAVIATAITATKQGLSPKKERAAIKALIKATKR